jgi:AmmeMemoRadiSam system protein B
MTSIRKPAVAGQFYSGSAGELSATVATLLKEAQDRDTPAPKALIVPHAGYVYSGPVAANAYARLQPYRDQYQRVILLGPSHRTPVRGLALCSADVYRTPMGDVPLDHSAVAALDIPGVQVFDESHQSEHSLEVHLPFLQAVLGDFSVVPIVVGDATPELVSQVLDALWGGPETLIVVSSDLSHYLNYDEARAIDAVTCEAIEDLDAGWINHDMACGATPVSGLLIAAKRHGMKVITLDLRNSGDTAGDRDYVVGYGAWMFV